MATHIIHRVKLTFRSAQRAQELENCVRTHLWADADKDLGYYPLAEVFRTLLDHDAQNTTTSVWYLDVDRRKQLRIVMRTANILHVHFVTPYGAHAAFFKALNMEKWGIQTIEGYYYDEFGAYSVGTFTRTLDGWVEKSLHEDDVIAPNQDNNYFKRKFKQAADSLSQGSSTKVRLSYDTHTLGDRNGPIYTYKKPISADFISKMHPIMAQDASWYLYDETEGELYPSVDYIFSDMAYAVNILPNRERGSFQVRYSGRISIVLARKECKILFDSVQRSGVQDLSFSFKLDGREIIPDDSPDLFFSSSFNTPLLNVEVESVEG